ncbi:hypothetical protein LAWI1_G000436 [Lachnellula willkommii]|uniref:Uncharacterized protein n=1 Tax=Lachnellula willkommii TaxID=215461 RepID=A0A559MMJ0_9HELO|nr:hypothetical protein LAWI1_G000436 [Lachnellula willkommii]
MPHKKHAYIERGPNGRNRFVIPRGRRYSESSEHDSYTPNERLSAAQGRMEALEIQIGQLQNRLSFEQSNNWTARRENERLTAENYNLQAQLEDERREVKRLDDMLFDLEKKHEKLEDKYKQLKRGSRSRSEGSDYRRVYEEKAAEVEMLRVRLAERDDLIRLDAARISEKNHLLREKANTIAYFKDYLRTHGFRVED